jgi:hypothetical protein
VGRAALELAALALDAQRPDECVDLLDECERASRRVDDRVTLTRARHLRAAVAERDGDGAYCGDG